MKELKTMTEQEIRALTDEDVLNLIKYKKASEGVKILTEPDKPDYVKIPEKDTTIYYCGLFDGQIVFTDVGELKELLSFIKDSSSKCSLNADYLSSEDDGLRIVPELRKKSYSSSDWDSISSKAVYSISLYNEVRLGLEQNKKIKEIYDKEKSAYSKSLSESQWIDDEVWEAVSLVRDKYYNLNLNVNRFINDYMPLADNDEVIAMNFLDKAYSLKEDEKAYVLANYKDAAKNPK